MRTTYQCVKCNHSFDGESKRFDGAYCPECMGPVVSVGGVVSNQVVTMVGDKPESIIVPKGGVVMGEGRSNVHTIEIKLRYLEELRRLKEARRGLEDTAKCEIRIARACDSIEKDLGLDKPFNVGDLTMNVNVEISPDVKVELAKCGWKIEEITKEIAKAYPHIRAKCNNEAN